MNSDTISTSSKYTKEQKEAILKSRTNCCFKCHTIFPELEKLTYLGKTEQGKPIWVCPTCYQDFLRWIEVSKYG